MFAATKTFASIVNRRETSLSPPAALLDRLGHGGALSASEQAAAGQVLHGTLSLAELRDGFFLHRTDVTYLRSMTSRWGVCHMAKRQITFALQLYTMPEAAQIYVVVHEYCHFLQPNHSPAFWAEVAKLLPDWKARRALLK